MSRPHDHAAHAHAGHDHEAGDHGHGHDHPGHAHAGHSHAGHGHAHGPPPTGRLDLRFVLAIGANLAFVVVELYYGWLANSVSLLADAGHNFGDVVGLAAAWTAVWLTRRPPAPDFTYGLKRSSVLSALANAVLLLVACGAIAWEAVGRFAAPPPVIGTTMAVVAAVGIAVNLSAAWLLNTGHGDINMRGAFLHMLADAAVSAGVVVSGVLITLTGWRWLDPVVSLAIVVVIVIGTWGLLRDSVRMSLDAVPRGLELAAVADFLRGRPGVAEVHDLHVWGLSTTDTALTAHLVMADGAPGEGFLDSVAHELKARFAIGHTTLQIESGRCGHGCEPHAGQ